MWQRSAPVLAACATVEACLLVIHLLTGQTAVNIDGAPTAIEWVVLAVVGLAGPLAALLGWLVARSPPTAPR